MGKGDGVELDLSGKIVNGQHCHLTQLWKLAIHMDATVMLLHPRIEIHARSVLFQQIGHCECTLGDALKWHLSVDKTPTRSAAASLSANCTVPARVTGNYSPTLYSTIMGTIPHPALHHCRTYHQE